MTYNFLGTLESWRQWGVYVPFCEEKPINRLEARPPTPTLKVPQSPETSQLSKHQKPMPLSSLHQARPMADQATSLEDLRQAIGRFEGCALKKTATNLVFSDGNSQAPVMLLGEAPGADEDRLGKPFVGLSGQLLDRMFAAIGWTRAQHLYISNMMYWRPPGNREPSPQEVAACLPFVEKHIALIQPKLLITVGGVATKNLLQKTEGIMKMRGRWHAYSNVYLDQPIPVMAIYHPAYLLRSPGQKRYAWHDLLTLKQYAQQNGLYG